MSLCQHPGKCCGGAREGVGIHGAAQRRKTIIRTRLLRNKTLTKAHYQEEEEEGVMMIIITMMKTGRT
jgi:hypothetical protein